MKEINRNKKVKNKMQEIYVGFINKEAEDANKSVLKLHAIHHHEGRADVNFSMKVTGSHTNCLDRQITERVNIENFKGPAIMNRRNEMGGIRVERTQYRRWGGGQ